MLSPSLLKSFKQMGQKANLVQECLLISQCWWERNECWCILGQAVCQALSICYFTVALSVVPQMRTLSHKKLKSKWWSWCYFQVFKMSNPDSFNATTFSFCDDFFLRLASLGVPLWCSGLKIQSCHCSGLGCCSDACARGSVLGLGTCTWPQA